MKQGITNFVTSFELSKELYDMGFKRDSIFSWFTNGINSWVGYSDEDCIPGSCTPEGTTDAKYPAYLSAELGEILPFMIYSKSFNGESTEYDSSGVGIETYKVNHEWHCDLSDDSDEDNVSDLIEDIPQTLSDAISNHRPRGFKDDKEANARATMVIYLITKKLIKLNEKDTLPG